MEAKSSKHASKCEHACARARVYPWGDGPRPPQDRRGGVRTKGAPFTSAQRSRILAQGCPCVGRVFLRKLDAVSAGIAARTCGTRTSNDFVPRWQPGPAWRRSSSVLQSRHSLATWR